VEATVIGKFGTANSELILNFSGTEVGRLSMEFVHKGIPTPTRKAVVSIAPADYDNIHPPSLYPFTEYLLAMLADPNVASKHWIIRQYDHEVQGGSVIKPLVGPQQIGPSDAAVIRPKLSSRRGIAVGCGMNPHIEDPYWMAIASIDEAVRNVVAVGGDPHRMAILDNFCWPSVDDEETMGTLVRACEACRDAALAYRIPFVSGKDSLHNQFTNKETGQVLRIPRTLLISAMALIDDVSRCTTMDFKEAGNLIYLIGPKELTDSYDLRLLGSIHRAVAKLISTGVVRAVHDVSDGGVPVAVCEMAIASGLGMKLDGMNLSNNPYSHNPGRYVVELKPSDVGGAERLLEGDLQSRVGFDLLGSIESRPALVLPTSFSTVEEISLDDLTRAWRGTLDW
jgi:phosphoribosylformylglycinamidine synthase